MSTTAPQPVAVKLDPETKERVKRVAAAQRRTSHWVMREAITQYVEREEKRAAFREAGLTAWAEYEATGLHVTAEAADDWLAELEAGRDVAPPSCHG